VLPLQGAQVLFLVGELRSHMPHRVAKKKKKRLMRKKKTRVSTYSEEKNSNN